MELTPTDVDERLQLARNILADAYELAADRLKAEGFVFRLDFRIGTKPSDPFDGWATYRPVFPVEITIKVEG